MSKQKFKGKTLYTKTLVDNIVSIATNYGNPQDAGWYKDAHRYAKELADIHSIDVSQAAGIIAALSPMKYWDENKRLAKQFLIGIETGTYGRLIGKARAIKRSNGSSEDILDILNGQKISAFYLNIMYPNKTTTVTVDRHAVEIALYNVVDDHTMTGKQYAFFQNAYIVAAERLNMLPHELQAVTWVAWKRIKRAHEQVKNEDQAAPF